MSDQIHAINIHWRLDTGLSISVNCPMFSSNKRWYAFYFFRLRIFCCFFFFEIALTKNSMPEAYPPDSLHYLPIRFLLIPFETYYYALFAFAERCRAMQSEKGSINCWHLGEIVWKAPRSRASHRIFGWEQWVSFCDGQTIQFFLDQFFSHYLRYNVCDINLFSGIVYPDVGLNWTPALPSVRPILICCTAILFKHFIYCLCGARANENDRLSPVIIRSALPSNAEYQEDILGVLQLNETEVNCQTLRPKR